MKVKPVLIKHINGNLVLRDNILFTIAYLNTTSQHMRRPGDIVCNIFLLNKKASINVDDMCLCYNDYDIAECTGQDIFYSKPDMIFGKCTAIKNGRVFMDDTNIFYANIDKIVYSSEIKSLRSSKTITMFNELINYFNEHSKLPKSLKIKKTNYGSYDFFTFTIDKIIRHNVQPEKDNRLYTKKEVEQHLINCVSELAAKFGIASRSILMKAWNDETMKWIDKNL